MTNLILTVAMMLPAGAALPNRTNTYYFAATCYNAVGLESTYSTECAFTNIQGGTNHFASSVTLAWDKSTDPTVTGYNLYWGTNSGKYQKQANAGTATNFTVTIIQATTNGQVWFVQESTNLQNWVQSPSFPGVVLTTNGQGQGTRFFRVAWTNWP